MREILFRGKRTDDYEWIEGSLCTTIPSDEDFYTISYFDFQGYYIEEKVIPESVGQDAGLTDKNGKKIFEGDIVKGTFLGFPVSIKDYVFSISWQEDITGYRANYFENVEVISNIHDNPELLKGGEHGDEKIY